MRIGIGFDAHQLVRERVLLLGGIAIPHTHGLTGHSDGDVLLHAVADALLGALALPDIGTRFPDTDAAYEGADSRALLREVMDDVTRAGYGVTNLDCVLICDAPAIAPHSDAIRASVAALVGVEADAVGLKAKTTEGTGLAIKDRSIAAFASVLLARIR